MTLTTLTRDQAARTLEVLKAADEPITAADLARRLDLSGCRETQRRGVRALVKQLRDDGARIVATLTGGYWLTDDPAIWRDYLEGRKIDARRLIGQSSRRQRMAVDADGQGLLFVPTERCGYG